MIVYGLFRCYGDGDDNFSESLLGLYDSYEKAIAAVPNELRAGEHFSPLFICDINTDGCLSYGISFLAIEPLKVL